MRILLDTHVFLWHLSDDPRYLILVRTFGKTAAVVAEQVR